MTRVLPTCVSVSIEGGIDVDMPVNVVGGLEGVDQPIECLDALVGRIVLVVDSPGWGACVTKISR